MTPSIIFLTGLVGFILAGCGAGPTPRLIALVGKEALEPGGSPVERGAWTRFPQIGLVVFSDATAQNAAPAITTRYLETLARRTEEFLRQRCALQEVVPVTVTSQQGDLAWELKALGDRLQFSYLVLVVLSSSERTGPEKFGEATMMTQMSGSVMENTALAEVGVLHLSPFKIVFLASGTGTEILEQLDAPIGEALFSTTTAQDIVRARAGQYALDRALDHLGSACRNRKSDGSCFTGNFRIAGQVQSPAL